MKIGVACGGTGGHIFPGLTTARALKGRGHDVSLWLAGRDVESGSIAGWDGPVVSIHASGLPTGISSGLVTAPLSFVRAFFQAREVVRTMKPDAMLAMGSYASVGPVLAARSQGVPVVLHEANVVPGRALSFLSRVATCVAISFPQTARYIRRGRVVHTGYPVRRDLEGSFEPGLLDPKVFTILVMGGSQGATFLNQLATVALQELKRAGKAVQVIHLAGRRDAEWVEAAYRQVDVPYLVFPFLKEMGKAYRAASLVLGRAGAGGCFELLRCRVPALLVPFPYARRDHQYANALALRELVGIDVIDQAHLTAPVLVKYLGDCIADRSRLDNMKRRMENSGNFDGADKLASLVESVASHATIEI